MWLQENGISTGIHYPIPCHRQPIYQYLNTYSLEVAERYSDQILSLPMFAELGQEEIIYVVDKIKEYFS